MKRVKHRSEEQSYVRLSELLLDLDRELEGTVTTIGPGSGFVNYEYAEFDDAKSGQLWLRRERGGLEVDIEK